MKNEHNEKSRDPLPLVQLRAEFQLPLSALGEFVELPSPEFWDGLGPVGPVADCGLGYVQGSGNSYPRFEVFDDVFLVHSPRLAMLNLECKNDISGDRYAVSMETMGDRIRQLRLAKGWTQEDLGTRVGVTKVAVSQWETGSTANIRLKTFLRLCDELGTSPHYMIFGPDQRPAPRNKRLAG